ncbi:AGE family epimerase/isomerase [Mangrovimonas sp. AS39]|uniref:AGE family epimerase/isomerase n=1 Tax=Mangrovimonas futianensis TaxID=2895523 RepID=UPI001E5E0F42|nr:AGE family epimerase/isomerase [Mangrovimonas futianensis]MCF1192306.1 AGE family epimerase/isomerase [Mangrovimonas futianensis]MCF1195945.1 AGE family epimerase/isomerase [Mangrovimonas futianensis]
MNEAYKTMQSELHSELLNILTYWTNNTIDQNYGGFVGNITNDNKIVDQANKGIILNTRILWSFAAASNYLKSKSYQFICERSFQYLKDYFKDKDYGGFYWELDYQGQPINKRKQVYAQAFGIYALSEYYKFSKDEVAKSMAIELFELIEKHAKDTEKLGYLEALNQDWSPIDDMRLSEKDMNAAKTMNTHLHVLEAYTTLLEIYPNEAVKTSLTMLVELFLTKFLNTNNHYHLFFDEDWKLLSNSVSYGHDIETIWLVIEAAKVLKNKDLLQQAYATATKVAHTFIEEAIDADGAVINEKNLTTNHTDTDRHWWPQVEALVGLKYAYQIQKNPVYLETSIKIWEFTKTHLIDRVHGEWFFRVDTNGKVYQEEDKVSMWKAPYHTSRACMMMNS